VSLFIVTVGKIWSYKSSIPFEGFLLAFNLFDGLPEKYLRNLPREFTLFVPLTKSDFSSSERAF
jgi:hypothetical protein